MKAITSCAVNAPLISGSLDRRLPVSQRITMHLHLMVCPACRAYRVQLVQLDHLVLARLRQGWTDEVMTAEEKARMSARLAGQTSG